MIQTPQINQSNSQMPKIKKSKVKIIVIITILVLISVVGIFFLLNRNRQSPQSPISANSLTPPVVNPRPGNIEMAGTFNPIILEFSESIKIQEIKISSTPDLKFTTNIQKKEPKKITLIPEKVWREEAYTIKIEAKFSSIDESKTLNYDRTLKYLVLPLPTLYFPVDPEASEEI